MEPNSEETLFPQLGEDQQPVIEIPELIIPENIQDGSGRQYFNQPDYRDQEITQNSKQHQLVESIKPAEIIHPEMNCVNQEAFDLDLIARESAASNKNINLDDINLDKNDINSNINNQINNLSVSNNSAVTNNDDSDNYQSNDNYGELNMNFRLGDTYSTPVQTPNIIAAPRFIDDSLIEKSPSSLQKDSAPSYTLNIVVRQFTKLAERKLNLCLNSCPLSQEPNIVEILSEGVDSNFDRIISSLGHIARKTPKRVTDAVMHWRRGKSELRDLARSNLEKDAMAFQNHLSKNKSSYTHHRKLSSRNKESFDVTNSTSNGSSLTSLELKYQKSELTYIQADRQFTISTFILWRVLIEVIRQTSSAAIIEDTGLEEIMYNYLRSIDPYLVSTSLIHSANWNLLSELIGQMSEKAFLSVSDRFISDLEKFPTGFTTGEGFSEASLNLLIHGMRYLQFSNSSLHRFEVGADFIKSLAKFFFKCENENVYLSYCDVINQLLLSLAGTLTVEVNHPTWNDAIRVIYTKSLSIANSNMTKYWGSAVALAVTALSVAPKEMFENKWRSIVDIITKKLKPKASAAEKLIIVTCISRLVWAYLFRYSDTLNSKTRTMETLANVLFLNVQKKQQWLTEDALLIQTAVQFFRALASSQLNFTLENIFIPFLKSSINNFNFEVISHEKLILCIRSYCCILSDYHNHEKSPYPTDDIIQNSLDPLEFSNIGAENVFENNLSNSQVHEEISNIFIKVMFLLESQCGCKTLDFGSSSTSTSAPSTPLSATSATSLHQRISSLSYFHTTEDTSYKNSELFTTVITCISWCANTSNATQYRKIVELLVKNSIHENGTTAQFCVDALKILICKKNPGIVLTTFASIAFCLDEKASSLFDPSFLCSDAYIKLLEVYLEVLQSWLELLTETEEQETEEKANTMYNVNHGFVQEEIRETKKFESLELKNMAALIDDVEGNGLFFLFSHDFRIRFLGCQILRMVTQFDEAIYYLSTDDLEVSKGHSRLPSKFAADSGTRIIEVLGSLNFNEFARSKKTQFSEAEMKRYTKFSNNERKNSIIKLAESSHGVDAAIWFKIFEEVLAALVKTCPIQIAIARSHSCIRLVQFYDQIVRINNQTTDIIDNGIIWDYMLYLKIACASLTTTNEQRLHIPDLKVQQSSTSIYSPLVKSHSRKRSQQLFTVQHQKITSAKSIFRMTVPLLTTSNARLRDALVEGLSCMNVNIFKTFIQSIESSIERWDNPDRGGFSSDMFLKQEICCILSKVTYRFSKSFENYLDESILQKLSLLLSNMLEVLTTNTAQTSFKYQRLRKYFCNIFETLHNDTLKTDEAQHWFGFNFRKRSFEFLVDWTGYGGRFSPFSERYSQMRKAVSTEEDQLNLQAALEIQKHQLQLSSISCISYLFGSPITDGENSFDLNVIFNLFDALFKTFNEKIAGLARNALLDILLVNGNMSQIFKLIVNKCYTHDPALGNYFVTLTDALIKGVKFEYEVYIPLSLALFSTGSDNYNVRSSAAILLEFIESKFYDTNTVAKYFDGVCCRSRIIYKKTLFELSSFFATSHPEERFRMISELAMLFNLVGSGPRRDLVAVLLAWVQTADLNLSFNNDEKMIDNYLVVLCNFFDITMRYSHKIQNELEALWVALGTDNTGEGEGVKTIYEYIIANSLSLKNLSFIECSRQVMVSISTIPGKFNLIDTLIFNMEPKSMIPLEPETSKILISQIEKQSFPELPYVAKLSNLIQENSSTTIPTFSLCELSIIFLADLILIPKKQIGENLPLILHLSIVLLDHQLFVVQDQAAVLIIHLLHEYGDLSTEVGQRVLSVLRNSDHSNRLWAYGDLTSNKNSGRVPDSMDTLVRDIIGLLEVKIPTIQKDWSITAIHWATTCKVMHIASRSFQVFRCLISFLDQVMLKDMLSCLTNTISDENTGIQGFSMQILMTLNAITSELYSEQLIAFPQLFWSSVASLTTIHENEFIEVLSTLTKFISKIDFNSQDTVNCLSATFPPKWEGTFEGLQKLIMIGLRSATAYEPTLKIMSKLNQLKDSQIIGSGKHRVLLTLLANMPRFLHAFTIKRFSEDVITAGNSLSDMADKSEIIGLSRIIESLIKRRFRNKEDFLSQIVNVLKRFFFPEYGRETLIFLLGLLFNKIEWIKIEIMDLLKHVFRVIDLTNAEFSGLGADLISPLLRLLSTDYVDQALEVLDEAASISPSPFDKHYLMMSADDTSTRKDYDKIVTLFGIPDDSGWSVPMPSVATAITRNNIHSVYSTCNIDDKETLANELVISDSNSNRKKDLESEQLNVNERSNRVLLPDENYLSDKMDESLHLSKVPHLSAENQYVQYNPLSPELQQQVNRHHQQQTLFNTDKIPIRDKDSLTNMLATLETLDTFFTKESGIHRHKYNSSIDTRSTSTTMTTNNTVDKIANANANSGNSWGYEYEANNSIRDNLSPKLDQGIQFDSSVSFRSLLSDVNTSKSERHQLSSPRTNTLVGGKKSRKNSIPGVEPLKLARDYQNKEHISLNLVPNSPLILESNNETEENDNMFGFDLLRQTNKARRRSNRLTPSYGNDANGNILLKNSPISPRNQRSPRRSHGSYRKSNKFRSYSKYGKSTTIDSPTSESPLGDL